MASIAAATISETARRIRTENGQNGYVAYHAPRYAALLALVSEYVGDGPGSVLDIGRSTLTELMRRRFGRPIDTLGFQRDEYGTAGHHYQFDLNDAQHESRWRRDLPQYQLVVMAEVIEHLHTSPRLVLSFIGSLMAPGAALILQTPNAAALHKRLALLFGCNPYEQIREDVTNPGHFREYTLRELAGFGQTVGLSLERHLFGNYFDYRYAGYSKPNPRVPKRHLAFMNIGYGMLPGSLRPGITVVMRKRA